FIAFSSLPQLAKKIKLFFALAPVYTFRHARGPVLKLAFLPDLLLKEIFGTRELVLVPRKEKLFLVHKCSKPLEAEVCAQSIFLVGGYDRKNLNVTAKTAEFKQFDYGLRNMEKYNQLKPPSYEIEGMLVPVAVWSGGHDWVTPHKETERFLSRLTHVVHHEHFPDWNHFDHHWGLNAPQRMYQRMVAMMEENP
ncbi:hypothetical protein EK904_015128, partial [Melospiza melodia maxima]